ncbi:sulfurtransferase [Alteribacillus sp. HJP-4]|uniref:sulfurtransferase n=1 Tax=Alteribacillus sp. HJP-4 TaxID=2775394 RepID=UPI0035CCF0F2
MHSIVTADWTEKQLQNETTRIVDCRFELQDPKAGIAAYEKKHITGAVHFDLEEDLAAPAEEYGGRHPLPDLDILVKKLSAAGIDQETTVIAYDDQGGAMAARFWWLLRYLGHQQVHVLGQPFSLWEKEGRPVDTETPDFAEKFFIADMEPNMLAHIEEVKLSLHDDETILIDARDEKRFKGIEDNVDPVAGHIPGAKHYFWRNVINDKGEWKSKSELQKLFAPLQNESVISYCGSGVTAAVNILAMSEAGYDMPRLYAGSWSDWVSYRDLPVEKSEE